VPQGPSNLPSDRGYAARQSRATKAPQST
jgi:hypothetical protein